MKWADILRVKSEFPVNLWPNAAQAYDGWIRTSIRQNMPYSQFAHQLLTAEGSNFREPPVNFLRAAGSREPEALGAAAALVFMGERPVGEIPLWLRASDALLLLGTNKNEDSSRYTSPMKLFEYMASKTPIVASAK